MMMLNQYASNRMYFWEDAEGTELSDLFTDRWPALIWALERGWHIKMGDEESLWAVSPGHAADWVGLPPKHPSKRVSA